MLEYLIVLIGALFVRLFPLRSVMTDFDTWGHLYVANEVRKQNTPPWGAVRMQCWQSDDYRHPYFWHWVIGRLPLKIILLNLKWINGTFDALFATLLYWILSSIFLGAAAPLIGVLLYLFTPMWFSSISIGTRVTSLTPRLFSELMVNLMLVLVFFDIGLPNWLQLSMAALAASSVILSSKFGVQALLFIIPLTLILTESYGLLFAILIGFLLPMIMSGGEVVKVLRRQIKHLAEYYRNNKISPNAITKRNKFNNILVKSSGSGFDFSGSIWNLLATNSYTSVIFKMPIFLVMVYLSISGLFHDEVSFPSYIFAPIIAATIIYFLINCPNLLFLGEAERYLNHVAVFIIIASVYLAQELDAIWLLWLLVGYGFLYWIFESFLISRLSLKKERDAADAVLEDYLKRDGHTRLVASFPYHNYCLYRIMLLSKHKVIIPLHMNENVRQEFVEKFETRYAYLDLEKLDEITETTSLDTLIIDKKALNSEGLADWLPPKDWRSVKLPQSVYYVFER